MSLSLVDFTNEIASPSKFYYQLNNTEKTGSIDRSNQTTPIRKNVLPNKPMTFIKFHFSLDLILCTTLINPKMVNTQNIRPNTIESISVTMPEENQCSNAINTTHNKESKKYLNDNLL